MPEYNKNIIDNYMDQLISDFNNSRLEKINKLCIKGLLKRKNIYMLKALGINTSEDMIRYLVTSKIISSEETVFGTQLEKLAIHLNKIVYNGWKSGIVGIDLEFEDKNVRNIISIKSGPSWGNSTQLKQMKDNFEKAQTTIRTNGDENMHIVSINGCCYGIDNKPDKGLYFKYCGQRFWKYISNNENTYMDIVNAINVVEGSDLEKSYEKSRADKITELSIKFKEDFCDDHGMIDWEKIVMLNAAE